MHHTAAHLQTRVECGVSQECVRWVLHRLGCQHQAGEEATDGVCPLPLAPPARAIAGCRSGCGRTQSQRTAISFERILELFLKFVPDIAILWMKASARPLYATMGRVWHGVVRTCQCDQRCIEVQRCKEVCRIDAVPSGCTETGGGVHTRIPGCRSLAILCQPVSCSDTV